MILNMAVYNVDTPDRNIADYTANFITENIYIQVDGDRYNSSMLYRNIGHRKKDDTIPMESGCYDTITVVKSRVITTN